MPAIKSIFIPKLSLNITAEDVFDILKKICLVTDVILVPNMFKDGGFNRVYVQVGEWNDTEEVYKIIKTLKKGYTSNYLINTCGLDIVLRENKYPFVTRGFEEMWYEFTGKIYKDIFQNSYMYDDDNIGDDMSEGDDDDDDRESDYSIYDSDNDVDEGRDILDPISKQYVNFRELVSQSNSLKNSLKNPSSDSKKIIKNIKKLDKIIFKY